MEIQKRAIKLQIFVFILFLVLPLNSILKELVDNKYINLAFYGIFIGLFLFVLFRYSRDKSNEVIILNKKYLTINKVNLYFYMAAFLAFSFSGDNGLDFKSIIFISLLIISAISGIIINILSIKGKF
jgi:hypothetical protein